MSWQAVLFDCDGVLLDTEPMGCEALAQAVTAAGRAMSRDEATRIFSGNDAAQSRDWMAGAGLDAAHVFARADQILFDMFERDVPLIPGIEQLLAELDVAAAVCSNSSVHRLNLSLGRTPLAHRFRRHVYSCDHVGRPKPAPELALFAANRLGIAPARAIFIDDNAHGIRCARAAGCLAVGFIGPSEHRPGHADGLIAAGADRIVHGMAEFRALLDDLAVPMREPAIG